MFIAACIVTFSLVGIAALAIVAIVEAGNNRAATTRFVFSAILPLLGTWVGTVLAFYFAQRNFEAGAASVQEATRNAAVALAGGVEPTTPVTRVMIPRSAFTSHDLGSSESAESVPLSKIRDEMGAIVPPSRRLPVLTSTGVVVCVVHDSTLTAYAQHVGQTTETIDKTLGDLLSAPEFEKLVKAIAFVSEKATVNDARAALASVENCNDVFVTATGQSNEPAIGWLTNTLLAGVQ